MNFNQVIKLAFLLISVIQWITCQQIKDPTNKIIINKEINDHEQYNIRVGQQLVINYKQEYNPFSYDLQDIDTKNNGGKNSLNIENYGEQQSQFELQNGCMAYPKDVVFKVFFDYYADNTRLDNDESFEDLVVYKQPQFLNFIIFTNKLSIIYIQTKYNDQQANLQLVNTYKFSYKSIFENKNNSTNNNLSTVYAIIDQTASQAYAFTEFGGIGVDLLKDPNNVQNQNDLFYELSNIRSRQTIQNIVNSDQYVFAATDNQFVDIYEIKEKQLLYVKSIDLQTVVTGAKPNVKDIKFEQQRQLLVVAEYKTGLYFFDLQSGAQQMKIYNFSYSIEGITQFDFSDNTYILIININNFNEAQEVFIDLPNNQYFVNQIYNKENEYYIARTLPNFALVLLDSEFSLLDRSIYRLFRKQQQKEFSFPISEWAFDVKIYNQEQMLASIQTQQHLRQLRNLATNQQYMLYGEVLHHFVISIADDSIEITNMTILPSRVVCHSRKSLLKEYHYEINSSDCKTREKELNPSIFRICNVALDFNLQVSDTVIDSENAAVTLGIVIGCVVFAIIIFSLAVWFYKKSKNKYEVLNNKAYELRKKKYEDLQNSPEKQQNNGDDENKNTGGEHKYSQSAQEEQQSSQKNPDNNDQDDKSMDLKVFQ